MKKKVLISIALVIICVFTLCISVGAYPHNPPEDFVPPYPDGSDHYAEIWTSTFTPEAYANGTFYGYIEIDGAIDYVFVSGYFNVFWDGSDWILHVKGTDPHYGDVNLSYYWDDTAFRPDSPDAVSITGDPYYVLFYGFDYFSAINNAYFAGYADGQALLEEPTLREAIFSAVEAPVNVLRNMLNVDVMGFNLSALVIGVFSLMAVVAVVLAIARRFK